MEILGPNPTVPGLWRCHLREIAKAPASRTNHSISNCRTWSFAALTLPFFARAVLRRSTALRATGMGDATLMKKNRKKVKEMEVGMLEGALKTLFKRMDEPDIFKVREILMRLAKTNTKPNQNLAGDWIIFWASREGCVDKLFGTGMTDEGWWLQLQEYLLRLSTKKQGREAEAIEIVRKVGPFPNQSNSLKGTYVPSGTNRLKIIFTEFKTDDGKDMKPRGDQEEVVIDVDVIYSSKTMIALQWEDANGECDFYVLTRVNSIIEERDKFVGTSKARNFFN
ncbi:unnamed protein product [Cladocopium goreaui]|uniref:Uncharacterized protein n=1 Tax=Cladocopium goreaui TaxID=2562237 RepID=A0A9P1CS14_9DINO|nr:unnamed protein product [Cladocopium goreaui]